MYSLSRLIRHVYNARARVKYGDIGRARPECRCSLLRAGEFFDGRPAGMAEKDIERKLKKRVEALGCMCLKFESPGYTGVPDRIVLMPGGEAFFVELKAPGKKERPRQEYVQQQFRELGFIVVSSVDSVEDINRVVALIEGYLQRETF